MNDPAPMPSRFTMRGRINPRYVIAQIADVTGLPSSEIEGPGLTAEIVSVRHAAMTIVAAARPDLSLEKIGELFGGRDHSTVFIALRKFGRSSVPRRRSELEIAEREACRSAHHAITHERRRIEDLVANGMQGRFWTLSPLAAALGLPIDTVENCLRRLRKRRVVEFVNSRWRLR